MQISKNLRYRSSKISKKIHLVSKILRYQVVHIYQVSAIFHFWVLQYRILLYLKSEYNINIFFKMEDHYSTRRFMMLILSYTDIGCLYLISKIGKVPDVI